ncbi:CPCC family cysteine-rich protein [Micromonospora chersina]|uniref:CPCC family cysteine-rich protein n=1 Tax=Micromonospora chersina TaxID=47854 RepID=UPI003721CF95
MSRRHHSWHPKPVDSSPVQRHPNDDPSLSDDELVRRRVAWFDAYTAQKNVLAPAGESPYTCPCCGHATLSERGGYEICDECGWETTDRMITTVLPSEVDQTAG